MKKTLVIILSIVLCIALAGAVVAVGGSGKIFNVDDTTSEPTEEKTVSESEQETKVESETSVIEKNPNTNTTQTQKNPPENQTDTPAASKVQNGATETKAEETTTSSTVTESLNKPLTAEDKALKAEIAKISDTKVDFRNAKQEVIGINTYNMTYKELINTTDKRPRIVYTSKLENGQEAKFTYYLDNGNLLEASVGFIGNSNIQKKVMFDQAQKMAISIANEYCDTSVYQLSEAKEQQYFYQFTFSRYISGTETSEGIYMTIEFDGTVSYLIICTDVFNNKKFAVDETKLIPELENELNKVAPKRKGYTIDKKRIGVSDGKPVMEYYVIAEYNGYSSSIIIEIPIE